MGFYSFQVFAKGIILSSDPIVQLGPGINVFSVSVPDVEAFKQWLVKEGAEIRNVIQLDNHEPVGLESLLLPDERALLGLEDGLRETNEDIPKAIAGKGENKDP
jgi:hypothetical protein